MSKKLWEILDITSVEAKLYIQGKTRFKTKFGAFMSLLALLAVCVLSIYFFIVYLSKSEVNVLFVTENKEVISYMDLNKKPFFFKFGLINGTSIDPTIGATTLGQFYFKNGAISYSLLYTEPCAWNVHFDEAKYKSKLKNVDIETYQCIKQDRPLNLTNDPFENSKIYNLAIIEAYNCSPS